MRMRPVASFFLQLIKIRNSARTLPSLLLMDACMLNV
jgi:hypothetical protein